MTEWLDLMLDEIRRKKDELDEAHEEETRRAGDSGTEDAAGQD